VAEFQGLRPYLPVGWDAEDPVTWLIPRADYDAAIDELSACLLEPEPAPEPVGSDRTADWREETARPLSELVARWETIATPRARNYIAAPTRGDDDKPGNYREEQSILFLLVRDGWTGYEAGKLCANALHLPRLMWELERQGTAWLCESWQSARRFLRTRPRAFGSQRTEQKSSFFGRDHVPRPPRSRYVRKQSSHKPSAIERQREAARAMLSEELADKLVKEALRERFGVSAETARRRVREAKKIQRSDPLEGRERPIGE
jgi:hypothetical protein